ncbi:MAG: response regulator [Verrucomicrobiae bacterium]|nr:response regulator [Verrucomicrobiae bacterium]
MESTARIPLNLLKEESREEMRPVTILSVEDNDRDFYVLEYYLSEGLGTSFRIQRARTLEESIRILRVAESAGNLMEGGIEFDIIFLTLGLADSQGLETFERLKRHAPTIPIIILSTETDNQFAIELVQQGAQDFLIKHSLSANLLPRAIYYAIERKRSINEQENLNRMLRRATEELKSAQMQLIQAEKLDSLGRLAAGVAHEVRNPLGAVQMGISYLMQRQSSLQDTGIGFACTEMEKAIRRADGIIQGMLDYAREDIMNLQRYCPNRLVEESVKFVQYDLNRRNVEIRFELDPEIPSVQIDTQRMNQVIINLISNSIQAMKTGGLVTVSTSSGKMGELERDEGLRDHLRLRSDETVVLISIRDTGPGIPPEKIHRIFEPFFTTKPTGEGTGLGLSVVDRIIQLHRGHITVENVSEPTGLRTTIALKSV